MFCIINSDKWSWSCCFIFSLFHTYIELLTQILYYFFRKFNLLCMYPFFLKYFIDSFSDKMNDALSISPVEIILEDHPESEHNRLMSYFLSIIIFTHCNMEEIFCDLIFLFLMIFWILIVADHLPEIDLWIFTQTKNDWLPESHKFPIGISYFPVICCCFFRLNLELIGIKKHIEGIFSIELLYLKWSITMNDISWWWEFHICFFNMDVL